MTYAIIRDMDNRVTDIAYVAGVMDSEGSFSITWNKHQATTAGIVAIANTHLGLLQFVHSCFGGRIFVQSRTNMGSRTICYQWICDPKRSVEFIDAILPYMKCKHEQAKVMREHLGLRMYRLTSEARKRRLELRERMLELNQARARNQHFVELTGEEQPTKLYYKHKEEILAYPDEEAS